MCDAGRRAFTFGALAVVSVRPALAQSPQRFMAEAVRMKNNAVAAGDQSYGAVLVKDEIIVGWGPSRVVAENNGDAHAERVALRDAGARLGAAALQGSTLYSTSIPCRFCQDAAARAGVVRMIYGESLTDGGSPRRL